ncbi:hypothetical protein L6452_11880 [Arctium lappa]|uniref:Uncharacterized protein n=1 Tax=Arctium lappa TaxID=4217 RepID=A0ACB9DQB5_ARCLA|nr:hypothetical protein L6452_11880 [Arctium lappa]
MDSDREEVLSFSDLRFSSDDDDLQMDSKVFSTDENNQNSVISSSPSFFNQDFSGFFSEELWSTTTAAPISSNTPDDIIFCGKVIQTSTNTQIPNPKNKTDLKNNNKSNYHSRCNSDSSCNCSINGHSSSSSSSFTSISRKKHDRYKNDVLAERTSKLACSSKSRWQVFMFGSGRFPTKMELSDIKSRQLRQIPATMSMEKGGGNRLTRLIRILGCGGGFNSDDTIRASLGYVHDSFDR